jgi:hypothetical protein
MSRWNIVNVIYYSKDNRRKILEFEPNKVTIITGASNTGKSAIINTIDYCLGSTNCNIAAFVLERTTHVATKWTDGTTEFFVAREILGNNKGSSKMYIEYGTSIAIPLTVSDFKGKGKKDEIRGVIEGLFGISQVNDLELKVSANRITLRQLTAFMYLDKGVIDSEKIIFHGLDDSRKAKYIIEALPYFLGAIDDNELNALRKLIGLQKGIEAEERKFQKYKNQQKDTKIKSLSLLQEAIQYKIIEEQEFSDDKDVLLDFLTKLLLWEPKKVLIEDKDLQLKLENKKRVLLIEVNKLKKQYQAVLYDRDNKNQFNNILKEQKAKLDINKFFLEDDLKCPICSSDMEEPKRLNEYIKKSFEQIKLEVKNLEDHQPELNKFIFKIEKKKETVQNNLELVNSDLRNLIKKSKEATRINNINATANRTIGRISYFLDNQKEITSFNDSKLKQYKEEVEEINELYNENSRKEKIELAERSISNLATENFSKLPKGVPCLNSTINFFSGTKPKIVLFNQEQNKNYQFANIGSDENYLSIHLAFAFAMQEFFSINKRAIPGVLLLDQVSRPYYSNEADDDEIEITDENDDDKKALRKHFDFIFDQVEKNEGLQVIILEHAYLGSSTRFKNAVKYRWPKNCPEKLIPSDWPIN